MNFEFVFVFKPTATTALEHINGSSLWLRGSLIRDGGAWLWVQMPGLNTRLRFYSSLSISLAFYCGDMVL